MLPGMGTRERPADRGRRRARAELTSIGVDLRHARQMAGLSLRAVGTAAGLSASQLSRIERGLVDGVPITTLAVIAAVVGLDVRVRAYPGPDPLRDQAQVRLLDRLRRVLPPQIGLEAEVVLPDDRDLRAWDGRMTGLRPTSRSGSTLVVEAETRFADAQAFLRRLARKRRDGGVDDVLVIVADTKANRRAVDAAWPVLQATFPVRSHACLAALRAGEHPGGSALVFL